MAKSLKRADLMTVAEVAVEKGVTKTAVLYAIQDGRLYAMRMGRNWVIPRNIIDEYTPRSYTRRATSTRRVPRTQSG